MHNQKPLSQPTESKSTFFTRSPDESYARRHWRSTEREQWFSDFCASESPGGLPEIQVSGPHFQNFRFSCLGWSQIICFSNKTVPVPLVCGDRGPVFLRTTALKDTEWQNCQKCHDLISRKPAF